MYSAVVITALSYLFADGFSPLVRLIRPVILFTFSQVIDPAHSVLLHTISDIFFSVVTGRQKIQQV